MAYIYTLEDPISKEIKYVGVTKRSLKKRWYDHCSNYYLKKVNHKTATWIKSLKVKNSDIFNYIKNNLNFDQLIWEFGTTTEPDWVHVSYSSSGRQRKDIKKAVKVNGKTQYTPYT
jgi:hypothetical protein